jgi:hypothetical protein
MMKARNCSMAVAVLALAAMGMGGCQGLVGWYMVKSGLEKPKEEGQDIHVSPYRLCMHLTSAFIIYSYVMWLAMSVLRPRPSALASSPARGRKKLAHATAGVLGITIVTGILVDDAIVEIENIVRHIRDGKAPYPAAIEAADEIGLAVIATTATLIAVFAPTGFMPGVVGQFFKSFAIATCVSVFFSLVVARTLTPLMGAYMLKADQGKEHGDPAWMRAYLKLLRWGLGHSGSDRLKADREARTGGFFRSDSAQGLNLGMGKAGGMVITF